MKIIIALLLSITIGYGGSCKLGEYIPNNAKDNIHSLYHTISDIISKDMVVPIGYFPALIEHESCVQLCGTGYWARRCWSPTSRLKTYWDKDKKINREEGAGLLQLTRAWRKNGTIRLDTINSLKRKYPKELADLTWDNVYTRPDLQMKAGLLLWKSNYNMLSKNIDTYNRVLMSDSIYNGGYKYFNRERKECALRKGCDSNIWLDNVEKINKRGTRILYGKRTAHDINRHHVRDVIKRIPKYDAYFYNVKEVDGHITQDYGDGIELPFYGE